MSRPGWLKTAIAPLLPRQMSSVNGSPNDLGQVGHDQNQCGGEENESRLANFRVFEHG